jgi:hypothetical protein
MTIRYRRTVVGLNEDYKYWRTVLNLDEGCGVWMRTLRSRRSSLDEDY